MERFLGRKAFLASIPSGDEEPCEGDYEENPKSPRNGKYVVAGSVPAPK